MFMVNRNGGKPPRRQDPPEDGWHGWPNECRPPPEWPPVHEVAFALMGRSQRKDIPLIDHDPIVQPTKRGAFPTNFATFSSWAPMVQSPTMMPTRARFPLGHKGSMTTHPRPGPLQHLPWPPLEPSRLRRLPPGEPTTSDRDGKAPVPPRGSTMV